MGHVFFFIVLTAWDWYTQTKPKDQATPKIGMHIRNIMFHDFNPYIKKKFVKNWKKNTPFISIPQKSARVFPSGTHTNSRHYTRVLSRGSHDNSRHHGQTRTRSLILVRQGLCYNLYQFNRNFDRLFYRIVGTRKYQQVNCLLFTENPSNVQSQLNNERESYLPLP